jgi:hypothetical protein
MAIKLQIGKAEQMVKAWGWDVDRRRLKHWLDQGWITFKSHGSGRGSMRFLTDESLMDVYLASQLSHDLESRLVQSCIRAARKHYNVILSDEKQASPGRRVEVVFRIDHTPRHSTQVRVPAGEAIVSISAIRRMLSQTALSVQRGRPSKDWREEFEENLAAIGKALRAHGRLTPAEIREDIRAYRARKLPTPEEVNVTVPA